MALQIKHRKKDDKYRAWSTISDDWYTDWLSRESMVECLQCRVMEQAKQDCEEISVTFPNGYWSKEGKRFCDTELQKKYSEILQKRIGR